MNEPEKLEYSAWLATSIQRYEHLAKSLVSHKPEKGRIVEGAVKSALQAILPSRFSIGTGFAISPTRSSRQLDVVIYDGCNNAPILLESGVGLFPIECIYGFAEIKSALDRKAVAESVKAIAEVRDLASEKLYVRYGSVPAEYGTGRNVSKNIKPNTLPPRSFLFAVNSSYGSIDKLKAELITQTELHDAHVHGVAVLGKEWFLSQRAKHGVRPHEFASVKSVGAFSHFCSSVLDSIQSMTIGPAEMTRYLKP